jgi:hypothetical protein
MKSDYYIVTFQTNSDLQSWHWEFRRSVARWASRSQRAVIKRKRRQSMRASESWHNFWKCWRKKKVDSDKAVNSNWIRAAARSDR